MDIVQMQRAPKRSKIILDRLLKAGLITEDGSSWLFLTTDVFHDRPIAPKGLPDGQNSRSLIRVDRTQVQVTAPATVTDTDHYDVRIDITPLITFSNNTPTPTTGLLPGTYNPAQAFQVSAGATARITPGVSVNAFRTGDTWYQSANVANYDAIKAPYSQESRRLVGVAYEVVNTTAPLYKSGSVTSWVVPTQGKDCGVYTNTSVFRWMQSMYAGLPLDYSVINKDPSALTWEAKHGMYQNGRFNRVQNQEAPIFDLHEVKLSQQGIVNETLPRAFGFSPQGDVPLDLDMRTQGLNYSGSWFTGLSPQTTLTITALYVWEEFIDPININYSLSIPTPMRDNLALEIYSRCLAEMPVACKQNENPLGEWFNTIMDAIAKTAPVIGALVPGLGPIIGGGVGALAGGAAAVNRYLAPKKQVLPPKPQTKSQAFLAGTGSLVPKQTGRARAVKKKMAARNAAKNGK